MFIVPKPQSMTTYDGFCTVEDLKVSADVFDAIGKDAEFFGLDIKTSSDSANLFFYKDADLKDEEYEILADEGGIRVVYSTQCGCFRALSTLKQIVAQAENGKIPCLKIHDFPDIPVRGLMLIVNSKRIYNMVTLYYIIDRLAELKYNSLQIYFDTFVFEYDSFKKHLDGKVYYTKEEIHQIEEYCNSRHIELVANVETFGHLQEMLSIDEFKHLANTRDDGIPFSINPLLDESFEVIKTMLDDLLPHFSSSTVNIGMDETYGIGTNETKNYCDAFGVGGLFTDFLTKVSRHIKDKHGKRSMIWGDMAAKHPESVKDIPKDVIFVDWGYEPGHKFGENALLCKEHNLDFYVAPGTLMWGSFTGRTDMMVQNIHFAAEAARSHGGAGFLLTEWTIPRSTTVAMLPYCFGGAFSWNSGYAETISEADNESNCMFRNKTVADVLAYFDKFILGCEGDSCAESIYRMGNYWMHEQPDSSATWNGTLLYKQFMNVDVDDYKPLSVAKLKRILNYLSEIREELIGYTLGNDETGLTRTEILCACDTAIYAAKSLLEKNGMEFDTACISDKAELDKNNEYLDNEHFHTVDANFKK